MVWYVLLFLFQVTLYFFLLFFTLTLYGFFGFNTDFLAAGAGELETVGVLVAAGVLVLSLIHI